MVFLASFGDVDNRVFSVEQGTEQNEYQDDYGYSNANLSAHIKPQLNI
jgi:hypothetical protein